MKYWVCSVSEENWKIVQNKGVLGVPSLHSDKMMQVEPGDQVVIFIFPSKPPWQQKISEVKVPGIYRAVSKPFQSSEDVGFTPITYEKLPNIPFSLDHRVKIEPLHLKKHDLYTVSREWKVTEQNKTKYQEHPA